MPQIPRRAFIALLFSTVACASTPATSTRAAPQLCIIRHAESYGNLDPRPADMTPEQLDALTPAGETRASEIRAELPEVVSFVWSSPRNRTQQTAAALGLTVEVVDSLRPMDEGESVADAQARANALIKRACAALSPGQSGAVVSHSDITALVLGALRGTAQEDRLVQDKIGTGELVCVPLEEPRCGRR